ncbi:MAG: hypothetical protein ACYCX4_16575 [Bacillota bacterium]
MTINSEKTEPGTDKQELEKRKYEFAQEIGICTRSQQKDQNESLGVDMKALSGEANSSRIEKITNGK